MLFEIVFGIVVYKLIRRFLGSDGGEFPTIDESRLCFIVADRFEKVYGGKAFVGLRIPDVDSGNRESIDAVVVTERELIVISVKNFVGYVDSERDGKWLHSEDAKLQVLEDPVAVTKRKAGILRSYLERRGLSLPQEYFRARVILPSPHCRVSASLYSASEVISNEKWSDLRPMGRGGFSALIKDVFNVGDMHTSNEVCKKLQFVLGTAPMWDRLEIKGDKIILGEFLEFKGNQEDLQLLKGPKRSKIGRIVVMKSGLFFPIGRSKVTLLCFPRDYRGEGTSASDVKEISVKDSTELIFQPTHSKKMIRCKLSSIVSLTLSV